MLKIIISRIMVFVFLVTSVFVLTPGQSVSAYANFVTRSGDKLMEGGK